MYFCLKFKTFILTNFENFLNECLKRNVGKQIFSLYLPLRNYETIISNFYLIHHKTEYKFEQIEKVN